MGRALNAAGEHCRGRDVELFADEMARIARALAVAPERFAALVAAEEGLARDRSDERWRLVLRRRDDRCVFLVGDRRSAVCGLGALAPGVCRGDAEAGVHDRVIARWNTRVVERGHRMPEAACLSALMADEELDGGRACGPTPLLLNHSAAVPVAELPEPRSQSGCATCTTARCCVVFEPELTGADLMRLIDGLALEAREVAELKPTRRDQAGADAVTFGDARAWDLRLRASAGESGKRCSFLIDLGRTELPAAFRCGVYAQRPLVCRLFPSDLTSFGVMVDTPEAICPPNAWAQERADLGTLHVLHLVARRERERYRAFVLRWNASSEEYADADHETRSAVFLAALIASERAAKPSDQASK